jgi:hypothetical protein
MAEKVSDLATLAAAAAADVLPIVDISDTSMAASGTTKKITPAGLGLPLLPSGDTTGAADTAAIQARLDAAGACWLAPGRFYLGRGAGTGSGNYAGLELPRSGAVLKGGAGVDNTTATTGLTELYMADGTNLDAMVATEGWSSSGYTSGGLPCHVEGVLFNGNTANNPSGLGHGLVLQSGRSRVTGCVFNTISGNGVKLAHLGADGTTAITNQQAEVQIDHCVFRSITGSSVYSNDGSVSAIWTDGFIESCVFAGQTTDAVSVAQAAGWLVTGCHTYGTPTNVFTLSKPSACRVTGNYIETWGSSSTAGTYKAVNFTSASGTARGNVVSGNVLALVTSPNAGSTIYGVFCATGSGSTGYFTVTGNEIHGIVTPATAAVYFSNGSSGSTLVAASTGNNISGFTTGVGQNANGGTMTVTAGA